MVFSPEEMKSPVQEEGQESPRVRLDAITTQLKEAVKKSDFKKMGILVAEAQALKERIEKKGETVEERKAEPVESFEVTGQNDEEIAFQNAADTRSAEADKSAADALEAKIMSGAPLGNKAIAAASENVTESAAKESDAEAIQNAKTEMQSLLKRMDGMNYHFGGSKVAEDVKRITGELRKISPEDQRSFAEEVFGNMNHLNSGQSMAKYAAIEAFEGTDFSKRLKELENVRLEEVEYSGMAA